MNVNPGSIAQRQSSERVLLPSNRNNLHLARLLKPLSFKFPQLTFLAGALLCIQQTRHASALRSMRNLGGFFIFQKGPATR